MSYLMQRSTQLIVYSLRVFQVVVYIRVRSLSDSVRPRLHPRGAAGLAFAANECTSSVSSGPSRSQLGGVRPRLLTRCPTAPTHPPPDRVFGILKAHNPELTGERQRTKLKPPQVRADAAAGGVPPLEMAGVPFERCGLGAEPTAASCCTRSAPAGAAAFHARRGRRCPTNCCA